MEYLIIFLSCITIFCSFYIFLHRNPVYSIISFIGTVLCYAILLLALEMDYLAFTLVIVYVGAIMVLFLFMMMMLNIRVYEIGPLFWSYVPTTLFVTLFFMVQFLVLYGATSLSFVNVVDIDTKINHIDWSTIIDAPNMLVSYGEVLYSYYFLELFVCALLLLAGMLGSIILTLSMTSSSRKQLIYRQVETGITQSLRIQQLKK